MFRIETGPAGAFAQCDTLINTLIVRYISTTKAKVNPLTDRQAGKQPNMSNKNGIGLPEYIAPLLQPTPTGAAKLVAAWDGLNTESQILILTELDKARLPTYLNEKIRIKALGSANAYVRYLTARGFHFSRDDSEERKAIRQRIEEDPDPLVRYCLMESEWNFFPPLILRMPPPSLPSPTRRVSRKYGC
jgi:hypothetical protein